VQRSILLASVGGLVGGFIGMAVLFSRAEGIEHGLSRLGSVVCFATGAVLGAVLGATGDITAALRRRSPP
jgi:hypothetical protein